MPTERPIDLLIRECVASPIGTELEEANPVELKTGGRGFIVGVLREKELGAGVWELGSVLGVLTSELPARDVD